MLRRRKTTAFRIPNPLAAIAAVVLLVTAWTGQTDVERDDALAAGEQPTPRAQAAVPDAEALARTAENQAVARISLMLFRFR